MVLLGQKNNEMKMKLGQKIVQFQQKWDIKILVKITCYKIFIMT